MWEAFLALFRGPQKQAEPLETQASQSQGSTVKDYQVRRIRPCAVNVYNFEADVVHVPTGRTICLVRGDTETDLRNAARSKVQTHIYQQGVFGKTLDI